MEVAGVPWNTLTTEQMDSIHMLRLAADEYLPDYEAYWMLVKTNWKLYDALEFITSREKEENEDTQ